MASMDDVPYTDAEADEARLWVGRHGPANAWTASNGTAARMIGRLLAERDRLRASASLTDAEREAIERGIDSLVGVDDISADAGKMDDAAACVLRDLLDRVT